MAIPTNVLKTRKDRSVQSVELETKPRTSLVKIGITGQNRELDRFPVLDRSDF